MAADALRLAIGTTGRDRKAAHLDEAVRWLTLATDVEHIWDRLTPARAGKKAARPSALRPPG
jgi:Arc/MetJ family transcription regulator